MSMALNDVCKTLNIPDARAREIIAERILALATSGERSPTLCGIHPVGTAG